MWVQANGQTTLIHLAVIHATADPDDAPVAGQEPDPNDEWTYFLQRMTVTDAGVLLRNTDGDEEELLLSW